MPKWAKVSSHFLLFHLLGLRRRYHCSDQHSSRIRALCEAFTTAWDREPEGQVVSIKTIADESRQRRVARSLMKREKNRAKNGSLPNTSTNSQEATLVISINHASALVGKNIEFIKQNKKGGQPKQAFGREWSVKQSQEF